MFGDINPKVRNLRDRLNHWHVGQTMESAPTAASGTTMSSSPAWLYKAMGYDGTNQRAAWGYVRTRAIAESALSKNAGRAVFAVEGSYDNQTWNTILESKWGDVGSGDHGWTRANGRFLVNLVNSNSLPSTLDHLVLTNTGTHSHLGFSFSNTLRNTVSSQSSGNLTFRAAGASALYSFQGSNSSISSAIEYAQIYAGGFYTGYGGFHGGKVTAGNADTAANSSLSTYGSFAAKGVLVTSSSYTLTQNETFVYVDPSQSNFCLGTPVACNTYMTEGNCNAHTGVGCNWSSGTDCSTSGNGTDQSTCESQGAGCVWDEVSCSGANNTDQATCEGQDDTYGGSCTWDESTCSSLGSDQSTCEAQSGCTWNASPCSNFSNTDQGTCEGNAGCTWDSGATNCHDFDATDEGTCTANSGCAWDSDNSLCYGVCSGEYDTSCTGSLCTGNYNDGNCSGMFGAGCLGTAACSNLITSGSCAAESGCAWTQGVTVTLPTTASANRSNTGRVYSIMHVGSAGTVSIAGQSGEPVFQFTTLSLLKKGDKVLLHNQNIAFPCSLITTESPCNAQAGCTWLVVCSTLGDEESCNAVSGCGWDGDNSVCTGRTTAVCGGTYDNGSRWYAHSLERGLNYTEKTANYTLLDIDDVVNVTSGSPTLLLPSAVASNGKRYILKNSGAGSVTVDPNGSETINGSSTATIAAGASLEIISNNANWISV